MALTHFDMPKVDIRQWQYEYHSKHYTIDWDFLVYSKTDLSLVSGKFLSLWWQQSHSDNSKVLVLTDMFLMTCWHCTASSSGCELKLSTIWTLLTYGMAVVNNELRSDDWFGLMSISSQWTCTAKPLIKFRDHLNDIQPLCSVRATFLFFWNLILPKMPMLLLMVNTWPWLRTTPVLDIDFKGGLKLKGSVRLYAASIAAIIALSYSYN